MEGDVHMGNLIRKMKMSMMTILMVMAMMTTWWSRMDHSDGWYSFCWWEPLQHCVVNCHAVISSLYRVIVWSIFSFACLVLCPSTTSPGCEGHDGVAQLQIRSHPTPHILPPLSEIMGDNRIIFWKEMFEKHGTADCQAHVWENPASDLMNL